MALTERHHWKKPRGPKWFQDIIDEVFAEITYVQPIPGMGCNISETENGRLIDVGPGGGGGGGGATTDEHYEFQVIDFSDSGGAKVLVYDGIIWTPNDAEPLLPDGMGTDDYIIDLSGGGDFEIWVEIYWDGSYTTFSNLNWGYTTPDSDVTVSYITIAYVSVLFNADSLSYVASISNAVCGDISLEFPPPPDSPLTVLVSDETDPENVLIEWRDTVDCGCDAAAIDGGGP